MEKEILEKLLTNMISTGCDFADIFYEDTKLKTYLFLNAKLDDIITNQINGIGLRAFDKSNKIYLSTNDLEEVNLVKLSNDVKNNFNKSNNKLIKLEEQKVKIKHIIKQPHSDTKTDDIIKLMKKIDKTAREYSNKISQVKIILREYDQDSIIANSNQVYYKNKNTTTRIYIQIYATSKSGIESSSFNFGASKGYELLDDIDWNKHIEEACKTAISKLTAKSFKGGEYPIILNSGFGAVIFHEACGHGLEACTVAPGLSVFKNDFNKKVASSKVTLIDDGNITNAWGSVNIDDEGNKPQKNILIENGILTSYLVDNANEQKIKHPITGSGRRENYHFAPTSRMNNTYIDKGQDKIEDMIKSINYGVYCKSFAGGSVRPSTGEFNFKVDEAYLIENGKISHLLKEVSLIGNSKDILNKIEMVSTDLKLGCGMCGSTSGYVPVTAGQPTIKVSNILIGGKED